MDTTSVRIVQLSDLHEGARRDGEGADATAGTALPALLEQAVALAPDLLVLSGDLIDRTAGTDYSALRDELVPFRERTGIPVMPVMGNHDDLPGFLQGLDALMDGAQRRAPGSADHARTVGGLQVVGLDTAVPGEAFGILDADQLRWLREVASRPAPLGTCVVLHHPPITSPMPQLRYSALAAPEHLADALADLDVPIILCGHYHHTSSAVWAGHLVWSAPAIAYAQDVGVPSPTIRGWADPHLSLIDIDRTGAVCTTVPVPDPDTRPVLDYPLDLEEKQRRWQQRGLLTADL